ncbi:MAG: type II secretion system F family protein [Verrucomicrobiales bacterium]|nr:type II secretion system F family protein [Verrucomicrobiales bacterium]
MSPSEKSHIFRNLAKYVRTGMGIEKACESMLAQPGVKASERQIYDSIEKGVTSGLTIAEAMSRSSKLDALDFQMLDASERGGQLDAGLNHLANYYQRLDRTRKRVRKGLVYPILLFHFALIVTTFVGAMFSRLNPALEEKPLMQAVWETGRWVIFVYLALLIVGILLFVLRRKAANSAAADRLLNQVPILGKTRRFAALERFTSVFEIFLLAGMRMDQSLKGASDASNSGLIRKAARTGVPTVKNGEKLAVAFFDNPAAFPNELARGVASAEEAGMLDKEFERWKQFYADSLSDAMDQLAEWVPKVVYFTTLFIVAAMIIRAGMAYRDLLNGFLDSF